MKRTLDDKFVAGYRVPEGMAQAELWDLIMPGLYLRASSGGRRTWMLRTNHSGERRRLSIGTWPAMPVAVARDTARLKLMTSVEEAAGVPFSTVCDEFERLALPRLATKTQREWRRLLRAEIVPALGAVDANDAPTFRAAVRSTLDGVAGRSAWSHNRVFEVVRRVFNWGVGRDLVQPSPVFAGIERAPEPARERLLTDVEVARILGAASRDLAWWRPFWSLLFFTGARRGTILRAEWDQFDLGDKVWLVPSEIIKGRVGGSRATAVPLVNSVLRALELQRQVAPDSRFVISNFRTGRAIENPQKAADRVRLESGVGGWHVHDVRRFVASTLARLGVEPHVIDAVLMHTSGGRVRRVYNVYALGPEKRAALEKLEAYVLTLRETPPAS